MCRRCRIDRRPTLRQCTSHQLSTEALRPHSPGRRHHTDPVQTLVNPGWIESIFHAVLVHEFVLNAANIGCAYNLSHNPLET